MAKTGRLLVPWYRYPPFSDDRIGGLSVVVWELTPELARLGVEVDILTPSPAPQNRVIPPGVRVVTSPLGEKFFRNRAPDRDEETLLEGYDSVLSIANYGAKTLSSSKSVLKRVTRQIHAVGQDRDLGTYLSLQPSIVEYLKMMRAKQIDERNLRLLKGSRTICVSEYLRQKMQSGLEDVANLFQIPNGVQTEKFRPMNAEKKYDILTFGRFQKSKGLDILLNAFNMIAKTRRQSYKLAIVGQFSVKERNCLLDLLTAGPKSKVIFLGTIRREELPAVINGAKALIVPSRYESFGLPALEAIACGVPVLAARVGGLPEIVDESVGKLVEPNNAEALAKAIPDTLQDSALARSVAIAGPEKARRYDWKRIAPEIQSTLFS